MFVYHLDGFGYNRIMCKNLVSTQGIISSQYYMNDTGIVKVSSVLFVIQTGSVVKIVTEDDDTVILPKLSKCKVQSNAVVGTVFRRLVVPGGMAVVFDDHALCGSKSLKEFLSLSRNVSYGTRWVPDDVKVRCV